MGLSHKRMVARLTDGSTYLSFLLPLQLNEIAQAMGLAPRYLLQHHTVFPYVTAFMPEGKAESLEQKVLLRPADVSLASLTASVTQAVPFRRVCKECIREDRHQHGESYWHRSHLLPGVHICTRHGTRLWETDIPLRSGVSKLMMPAEAMPYRYRPQASNDILETVTRLSNRALDTRTHDAHLNHRALACLKGYLLERGCIPTRELSRELHRFYGQAYLAELKMPFRPQSNSAWPSLLVRVGAQTEAIPSKHILLETFLCLGPSFTGQTDYARPGPKPDYATMERKALGLVKLQLNRLTKTNTRMTVPALLAHAGVWHQFRHNRNRYPYLRDLVQEFRASSLSERQLGGRPRKKSQQIDKK